MMMIVCFQNTKKLKICEKVERSGRRCDFFEIKLQRRAGGLSDTLSDEAFRSTFLLKSKDDSSIDDDVIVVSKFRYHHTPLIQLFMPFESG